MSDVTSVINHFSTSNEGFQTTISSPITAGAITIPLSSVTGLTNATIFVGIIEPGETKQQTFTGTVDTSGSQITGVKWTRGTNVDHGAGVTIVDYVTGTDHNMMTKGILVQHNQDGTHSNVTATALSATSITATNLTVGTSLTIPNTSVTKAKLEKPHYSALYMAATTGGVYSNIQVNPGFDTADPNTYGITATTGASSGFTIARDGIYNINYRGTCIDVTTSGFITWIYITPIATGSALILRKPAITVAVGESFEQNLTIDLKAGDIVQPNIYSGSGGTRFGAAASGTLAEFARRMLFGITITEIR